MKKLLIIVVFFWEQNGIAAENLGYENTIQYRLYVTTRDIESLIVQGKITDAYTKAAELETRNDFAALMSKCGLAALLQTFPDDEATQLMRISGIDKDASYEQETVGYSFYDLLALHHCCICSGDFQLAMRAKAACKFLLGRYPNYEYAGRGLTLTFAEIAENAQTTDNIGRELLGIRNLWFFYPNDENKIMAIKEYEKQEEECVYIDDNIESDYDE